MKFNNLEQVQRYLIKRIKKHRNFDLDISIQDINKNTWDIIKVRGHIENIKLGEILPGNIVDMVLMPIYKNKQLIISVINDRFSKDKKINLSDYTNSEDDDINDIYTKVSGTDPKIWELIESNENVQDKGRTGAGQGQGMEL